MVSILSVLWWMRIRGLHKLPNGRGSHSQWEFKIQYLNFVLVFQNSVLKNDRMISIHFQGKPFNITVNQVYATTTNPEEAEWFYEDWQDLLELTPTKDVLFITGDWNATVGSQEIPGMRQVWPWSTKWSKEKDNRILPREHNGHS